MEIQKPEREYRGQNGNTEARIGIQRPKLEYRGQNWKTEATIGIQMPELQCRGQNRKLEAGGWKLGARIGKLKPALRC